MYSNSTEQQTETAMVLESLAANPLLIVITAAVLILLFKSLRVANQYERSVVFRLGKFNRTAGPGLYLIWPFIE
jgi:regulator of protease activity HflC (stomatin/prohibitin superfamily)